VSQRIVLPVNLRNPAEFTELSVEVGFGFVADTPFVFSHRGQPFAGIVRNLRDPAAGCLGDVGSNNYVVVLYVLPLEPTNFCTPQSTEPTEDEERFQPGVCAFFEEGFQFTRLHNFWLHHGCLWSVGLFCRCDPSIQVALALGKSKEGNQGYPVVQSRFEILNGMEVVVNIIYGDPADFVGDFFAELFQVVADGLNVAGAPTSFFGSYNKFIGQFSCVGRREGFFKVGVVPFVELQEFADGDPCQFFWFVGGGCRPPVAKRVNDERCGIQHVPQMCELFADPC
jgi:hypothetical protein